MSNNLADLFLPSNQCDRQIFHGLAINNCGCLSKCPIIRGLLALDNDGLPISDLKSIELRVRVNKEDRNILSLSAAPEGPRTIGLFFEISGSRRNDKHIEKEIEAAANFLQSTWRDGDEGFVLAFGDKLYFVARPTHNLHQILELLPRVADGRLLRLYCALRRPLQCSIQERGRRET
jgi:hypothetical protein